MAAIENNRSKADPRPPIPVTLTSDIPELPVVKATRTDTGTAASENRNVPSDADESRPLIIGEGSRIETRSSAGESPGTTVSVRRNKDKPAVESTAAKRPKAATDSGKKAP
jgi:hypothetical protein